MNSSTTGDKPPCSVGNEIVGGSNTSTRADGSEDTRGASPASSATAIPIEPVSRIGVIRFDRAIAALRSKS